MVDTSLNIMVKLRLDEAKKDLNALRNAFNTLAQSDMGSDTKKYQMLRKNLQIEQQMLAELGESHSIYKQTVATSEQLGRSLKVNERQMNNIRHATKGFNMDFLTLIFAGMWLKQTFGGFFNMIINDYKRVMGMNSMFTKGVLKLQASFGYLKFAIGNALNSPGIVKMIEKISNAIIWLGDWISEHPGFAQTLLIIAGALGAIGAFSMVAGGIEQVSMLFGLLSASNASTAITNLGKLSDIGVVKTGLEVFGVSTVTELIIGVLGVIAVFATLFGLLNEDKSVRDWTVDAISTMVKGIISIGTVITRGLIFIAEQLTIGGTDIFMFFKNLFKNIIDSAKYAVNTIGYYLKLMWAKITGGDEATINDLLTKEIEEFNKLEKTVSDISLNPIKKETYEFRTDDFYTEIADRFDGLRDRVTANAPLLKESIDDVFGVSLKNGLDIMIDGEQQITNSYVPEIQNLANYLEQDLNMELGNFNNLINENSNDVLPNNKTQLEKHISMLDKLTDSTNKAASAQERLNRAKKDTSSSLFKSGTVSTSTKASSLFRSGN